MIGSIEQAIVDRVRSASEAGALGYQLRTVASYGGELADLAIAVRSFPAVWVAFAGERRAQPAGPGYQHDGIFTLFVGVQSRRGDRAARLGVDGEPGSLQVLEDVRAILAGDTLGLEIGPLTPVQARSVSQAPDVSVYAFDLSTQWISTAAPATGGEPADFLRLHLDWDIPPHGNVVAPLPADEADAQADVTLEGASA